jgi:hypothetical protein
MRRRERLPLQALQFHLARTAGPMQPRDPGRGLGRNLRRYPGHFGGLAGGRGTALPVHAYQPSIQRVTSIVALATCFSTALTVMP